MSVDSSLVSQFVDTVALVLALLGIVPVAAGSYQSLLAAVHGLRNHYGQTAPLFPRLAVVMPAWNEGAVVGASIDRLMQQEYPADALRIYVVDDASDDDTPEVVRRKAEQYPGRVVHLRRERGGQGKAHTLNHGIARILADDWAQAVLIMDADVIFPPTVLRKLTRHLADPRVGAVTAYITEGSRPDNYLTRFIGYEYVSAQAAARRGQNVLGVLACLAGGAQLHTRENLVAIGGRIDTSTLAEDTVTTFVTQLHGRRALFEPHAVTLAEEPGTVAGLWKQRLRWARGNFQVTRAFSFLWFRKWRARGLGGLSFGIIWFALLLQPFFMISSTIGLVTLFFTNPGLASTAFRAVWLVAALTFVLTTVFNLLVDPATGRRCWREAFTFPGLGALGLIVYAVIPEPVNEAVSAGASWAQVVLTPAWYTAATLAIYAWPVLSLAAAWLARGCEGRPRLRGLTPVLVYLAGYGPMLCAITLAAFGKQLRGADLAWDKTTKTGRALG